MEPERQETYERIPWETLEKKSGDRQWMVYAVAGAVVLGALAYSFMRNQPVPPPVAEPPAPVASTVPEATTPSIASSTPSTMASPVVVAEADLYAVDPERLVDQVVAHAEWVAIEYMAVDGSEQSRQILTSLLPSGTPLPEAPEGVQVFVDWVRARSVTQTGPGSFDVGVLVRSLASGADGAFVRQPPSLVSMSVEVAGDGMPRVTSVPTLEQAAPGPPVELALSQPPEDVVSDVEGEVVGGVQRVDGGWDLVVRLAGPDGVVRPVTISR